MADAKLADLTAVTAPADTDIVYAVVDPAGTPADRKVTVANLRGDRITHDAARMLVYGHSLAQGGGSSDPDRDVMTHLASMLKMREMPRALGGAILHWHNNNVAGDGGYVAVLHGEVRTPRANTTLSAQANSGSTTIAVTSATGLAIGQLLHVGTGDTGSTGGESLFITAIAGTTITVQRTDGTATTARTHLSGEPVYVEPTYYVNMNPLYLMWYGNNDLPASPITSADKSYLSGMFTHPLRMIISRARCAEIYENDHKSCVYTGSWTPTNATNTCSGGSVNWATAVNAAVTIHTPDNFPGGTIGLAFEHQNVGTSSFPMWSFTVDGTANGTLSPPQNYTGKVSGMVKRLTSLTAGRHVIVATLTTLGSGNSYFDYWGVEATTPPLVIIPGLIRPHRYTLWPTHPNARRTTTLTGVHGIGTTSWTVASTTGMLVGATVTFEEGGGNAETLEVLTVPSGTTFTTAASTISHAGGITVVYGQQDADIPKANTLIQAVIAEFDAKVKYIDIDSVINKDVNLFWHDGAHLNDHGHIKMTESFYSTIRANLSSTVAAYTSVPTAPLPSLLTFANNPGSAAGANTQWTNMPAALTELFGQAAHRKFADLRRCFEARFVVGVQVAGVAGSSLRIQYSLDSGTTWKYLFRTALYAEDTSHEAILTSTGMKDSGWRAVASDALVDNVLLRVVGINGNATADPTFGTIDLYFR